MNVRACNALGHPFVFQLGRIYDAILKVYRVMSENISAAISIYGENFAHIPLVKSMRLVKKLTLEVFTNWVSSTNDPNLIATYIAPLFNEILPEYQHCAIASAREPEVLSTIAAVVNKLEDYSTSMIPQIFEAIFDCTLGMINQNYEEFPEHRLNFYVMLQAVNRHCFPALRSLPPAQLEAVLDTVIRAIQHKMRNVADTGLDILYQLLQNVSKNEGTAQAFYQAYYTKLIQHVFGVVTDGFHSASLKKHLEGWS